MQALLDQAHNDEDDMFQEVADDTEFTAPSEFTSVTEPANDQRM
jgi:hypothetical protein